MNSRRCLIVAAILLVAAGDARKEAIKSEMAKLTGAWTLTSMKSRTGKEVRKKSEMVIGKDGSVEFTASRRLDLPLELVARGGIELDPSATPKFYTLTQTQPARNDPAIGVYELDGDVLRWCYMSEHKRRPKKVSLDEDGGDVLLTFERKKQ
jgi:uncharacterized protein (TIGR03067 family)